MIRAILLVLLAAGATHAPAADFDLPGFIEGALKAGQKRVVVPPGRYRVTPRGGSHLAFKNLADVEILADGVEMVCTQTMRALDFENCRNLRFKGLTIDYDPLPMTEGRITALPPDKSWVEFEVIPGYPDDTLVQRVEIYDPATGELRRTDAGWAKDFEPLGNHRYRIAKRPGYRFRPEWDTEQVGDILVTINASPSHAGGHAVTVTRCVGVKLEDVTVYASPCFGFVEHQCDGSTYLRCKIDRRRPEDDPVKRGFPRMRSLSADAFHSTEAVRGPAILQCTAKFMGDDCVNIHGTYHMVLACDGMRLRIAAAGRMTIEPGDPIEFLPFEGRRPPDAVAVKIEPDAPMRDAEHAFIAKLNMNANIKERLLGDKAAFFTLHLDRPVALPMGSMVCAGNRVGNGFAVRGCDFGYNRCRGILIKASRGEVSGNTITRAWMAAVLIAPEFWWFEASSSCDVVVRDNTIVGCRRAAIEIIAPGGGGKPLASGAHRNLTISGITIRDSVWPNIHVTSTEHLVIQDNRLTPADPEKLSPPQPDRWRWGTAKPAPIVTEQCEQADVQTR